MPRGFLVVLRVIIVAKAPDRCDVKLIVGEVLLPNDIHLKRHERCTFVP